MKYSPTDPKLKWHDKAAIAASVILIVAFSIITLFRSAYLSRPMTDAQVYCRAGWAVASGISPYEIQDQNGLEFFYPPFFSLLTVPFADPPPGEPKPSYTFNYGTSVILFYYLGVAFLLAAIFIMARATERYLIFPDNAAPKVKPGFWHPYWLLRLGTLAAMLYVAAAGLKRGQVSTLILLLMVWFIVWLTEARPFRAGFVLGLAAAIKVFPVVALLLPLLRRDWRTLSGFAFSSVLFWGAIPYFLMGHDYFIKVNRQFFDKISGIAIEGSDVGGIGGVSADSIGWGSLAVKHFRVLTGGERSISHEELASYHYPILLAVLGICSIVFYRRVWVFKGEQPRDKQSILVAGSIVTALLISAATAAQEHYIVLGIPLYMLMAALIWIHVGEVRITRWNLALSASFVIFPILNGIPSLGSIAWIGVSVYPIIFSVIFMCVFISRPRKPGRIQN